MTAYEKLGLTDEQKKALSEFQKIIQKCIEVGLYFVECPGYGLYAYNTNEVSCFNAPENAAYDNGKEEIDILKLHEAERFGLVNYECLPHDVTKCLVAFK